MTTPGAAPPRSPAVYFGLVFALTLPFLVLGGLADLQLMPGLPIAALAVVCPALAALMLVQRSEGWIGVAAWLRRAFVPIRPAAWLAPVLLIMPAIMLGSFWIQRQAGVAIPMPQLGLVQVVGLSMLFFVAAVCEELGWSSYATDPLIARFGPLGAGLVLGLVWAIWHYVPLAQAHRSVGWIACWSVGTVATRMIIVWLYARTGASMLAAALFHMTMNITWQTFPIHGSFYDPRVTGPLSALVAGLLILADRQRAPPSR